MHFVGNTCLNLYRFYCIMIWYTCFILLLSFQVNLSEIFIKFALNTNSILIMKEDINRIKVVLAEKKRTNKWLAEKLGKDPATVSKWCTNSAQPGLETLVEVARLLDVDVAELLRSSKING